MADWAAQNPEITSGLLTVAGTVAGLVLTMLTVNAAVAGWNNLRASIHLFIQTTKLAAAASRAMGLAMAMTPMGMAVVAIAAVVAGLLYLWNTSEGFRDFVMSLPHDIVFAIGVIAGVIMSLPGVVYDVVVSIGTFLPMLPAYCIEAGAEFVVAAGQWASEAYDAVMNWISQLPDAIYNAISGAWENIKATFSAGVTVGVNAVEAGKSAAGGVFTNPYLTWVAEAGHPEVIVPITHDQNAYNLLGTAARMLGVPSMSMPSISAPSSGSGGINVNYAPVINVNGSGDAAQLSAMLEQERRKLEAMLQRVVAQQRRVNYV